MAPGGVTVAETLVLGAVLGDVPLAIGEGGPGGLAFFPPGTVDAVSNSGDETVRVLDLIAPGGFEHDMKEVARGAGAGTPDPRLMAEIASRYDFEPV